MKRIELLNLITENGIISKAQSNEIENFEQNKPFSIHWEVRTLLYIGIVCLSTGIGILIYKNIDTIGHNILIGLIAIVSIFCFYYASKHAKPFTWLEAQSQNNLADFALLGACLSFLSLETYLQYQYNVFGNNYGIAALIPAILFFICAYRYDHVGVLSMAITALGSWLGITIAPVGLWKNVQFNTLNLTITAILLGILLIIVGWLSEKYKKKSHFSFTYFLFGGNLAFLAGLAGLFNQNYAYVYFLFIIVLSYFTIIYARKTQSYLFLLLAVIYGYIAFTYSFFKIIPHNADIFLYQFYFLASAIGIIYFLINIKKIIKNS